MIDGATNQKVARIPAGSYIRSLCYNPNGNKVYCATSNHITVIDGATNQAIKTITVGEDPRALTWNPAQNRTYVANYPSFSVSVIRDSMTSVEEVISNGCRGMSLLTIRCNAGGPEGAALPAGVYFVRLEAGDLTVTEKVVVLE